MADTRPRRRRLCGEASCATNCFWGLIAQSVAYFCFCWRLWFRPSVESQLNWQMLRNCCGLGSKSLHFPRFQSPTVQRPVRYRQPLSCQQWTSHWQSIWVEWEVLEQEQSGERAKMALKVHSSLWTVILLSNRINFHVSKFSTSIWILTPSKHDYVGPTCVRHAPHQRIWKLTRCRCDVICSLVWQQADISMTGRLLILAF